MKISVGAVTIFVIVLIYSTWGLAQGTPSTSKVIKGGGATFPSRLYQIAIADFEAQPQHSNSARQILYNQKLPGREQRPLGSEQGKKLVLSRKLEFAGSDWPFAQSDLEKIHGVQIPSIIGAVVIVYNIPGLTDPVLFASDNKRRPLEFSADVLARIFQGKITRWDDALIQRDNPDAILPSADIVPVHRSDGSGTTHIFTNFLTINSPNNWNGGNDFKGKKWAKNSIQAKGSEALAQAVSSTAYSIGYVEYDYAQRKALVTAKIQVRGSAVEPTIETIGAALKGDAGKVLAREMAEGLDEKVQQEFAHFNDSPDSGKLSYPISGFTWLILSSTPPDELCDFLRFLPEWSKNKAERYKFISMPAEFAKEHDRRISAICSTTASSKDHQLH